MRWSGGGGGGWGRSLGTGGGGGGGHARRPTPSPERRRRPTRPPPWKLKKKLSSPPSSPPQTLSSPPSSPTRPPARPRARAERWENAYSTPPGRRAHARVPAPSHPPCAHGAAMCRCQVTPPATHRHHSREASSGRPQSSQCLHSFLPALLMSDLWMWGMTPPPAMVALIRVSSSSSPRMASCRWRGVMRLTYWGGGESKREHGLCEMVSGVGGAREGESSRVPVFPPLSLYLPRTFRSLDALPASSRTSAVRYSALVCVCGVGWGGVGGGGVGRGRGRVSARGQRGCGADPKALW